MDFDILQSEALKGVPHGFFGHGVSENARVHQFGYGGPGDELAVAKARAGAANALVKDAAIVTPHQVHSSDVVTVTMAWADAAKGRPVADALVTATPGLVLGIVTADCGPVLFADRSAGVIGAAHAGWRGAHGGVLENTLAAMEAVGASRDSIAAAIGPTIAQASYEVDAPFRENFGSDDEKHFASAPPRDGWERWLFDLPGYISARLSNAGIALIHDCKCDTFAENSGYFSYRKSTQKGEPNYGRQLSAIGLE